MHRAPTVLSIREMDYPHDGIRFQSTGATRKLSFGDSVYIMDVGQAVVGNVVREEHNWVLIVFVNIKKISDEPHYSLVRAIWINKDLLA